MKKNFHLYIIFSSKLFIFLAGIFLIGMSYSCKTPKLEEANRRFDIGEYYEASQMYRRIYNKTSPKKRDLRAELAFMVGESNRMINSTAKSLGGYQNAIRYDYPDSIVYLYTGMMLLKNGKYGDAAKYFDIYLSSEPANRLAQEGKLSTELAPLWKKSPTRYEVKKMDKFNSRRSDFSPMFVGKDYDQLYITSSREDAKGETKSGVTGLKYNDFFLIKKDEKGVWQAPETISDPINSDYDDGVCSFTSDGNTMYFTRCSVSDEGPQSAKIFYSMRSGAQWSEPTELRIFRDTTWSVAHPSVSANGEYLYFCSDIANGYGGKDIWRAILNDGIVAAVENLGEEINTEGDEMFPYIRENGELYFASNGHTGMGGLDIYRAIEKEDGSWEVQNMGAPINSNADDFGITFEGLEERGYFSSNRNDARGYDKIYSFALPSLFVEVEGWVVDKDDEIIPDAIIRVVGDDGNIYRTTSRKDGHYSLQLERGTEYVMMASAPGYMNGNRRFSTTLEEKNQTYPVDFILASITKPVLIENIFYDFDKATLRPESKEALDELIALLNDNPHVTIELAAHTDMRGSDEYNMNLSQRRAKSVVDYLINGGIDPERLTPVGYGESVPKTINKKMASEHDFLNEGDVLTEEFILALTPEQQEIAHQINRRTEFQVLKVTYKLF
ncbi:MAG: OmpA family protein [Candidatus Azobacteroides sp.]|nr:OmpA family protein [Candidatus Azobacteroides sp.]